MENDETTLFDMRPANGWLQTAKKRPIPRQLFGELWLEGEIAILFGETGKGRSVLAMQIAESIAAGGAIEPFRMTAEKQKVLYVDLEMNEKQFEMRYAADHEGGRARFLHRHYKFSDDVVRVEQDPADAEPRPAEAHADAFYRWLRPMIDEAGAKVVIIDSITSLKRSYYGTRETQALIKTIRRLRKESGLSFLLLIQTPKHDDSAPLSAGTIPVLRVLMNRADSMFAIGQSRLETAGRYIKHFKTSGDTLICDATHVPSFRLHKLGGNFLGFEFTGFAPEAELLADIRTQRQWETIEKIKLMKDGGASIRSIAEELGLSKTTAHRLLKMWRPPLTPGNSPPYEGGVAAASADGVVLSSADHEFPGCEEYDEAMDDPRFEILYMDEDDEEFDAEEQSRLNRESYLIELARADARRAYEKTGVTPRLKDHPKYREFLECVAAGKDPLADNEASPLDVRKSFAFPKGYEDLNGGSASSSGVAAEEILTPNGKAQLFRTTDGTAAELKPSHDAYGREIFIEKQDERGKPIIWYSFDSHRNKMRHERKPHGGIIVERIGNSED